jgi:hypothetical protein
MTRVRLGQPIAHKLDRQLIGNQIAPFDVGRSLAAQGRFFRDRRPKYLSRRDTRNIQRLTQPLTLGSFPRTWAA